MLSVAFACAVNSELGGYRRSSWNMVSIICPCSVTLSLPPDPTRRRDRNGACVPLAAQGASSYGSCVSVSQPSSVTRRRSSIRQPPNSRRYGPGSTATTPATGGRTPTPAAPDPAPVRPGLDRDDVAGDERLARPAEARRLVDLEPDPVA